tara:strand:+ start:2609 stop:3361 length:753 start_codon:yes stop_codon:yes gene_type:complete
MKRLLQPQITDLFSIVLLAIISKMMLPGLLMLLKHTSIQQPEKLVVFLPLKPFSPQVKAFNTRLTSMPDIQVKRLSNSQGILPNDMQTSLRDALRQSRLATDLPDTIILSGKRSELDKFAQTIKPKDGFSAYALPSQTNNAALPSLILFITWAVGLALWHERITRGLHQGFVILLQLTLPWTRLLIWYGHQLLPVWGMLFLTQLLIDGLFLPASNSFFSRCTMYVTLDILYILLTTPYYLYRIKHSYKCF